MVLLDLLRGIVRRPSVQRCGAAVGVPPSRRVVLRTARLGPLGSLGARRPTDDDLAGRLDRCRETLEAGATRDDARALSALSCFNPVQPSQQQCTSPLVPGASIFC